MNDDRQAVRVGGVTLAVVAVAIVLVLGLEGRHLRRGLRVHVEVARIGALQQGAPVRLAGLELGTVEAIRLVRADDGTAHAMLDLWLDRRRAWLVRTTTEFFLSQEGLLGETYVEIGAKKGEPGPPLDDGATVRGVDPPHIDELLTKSYRNLTAATALFRDGLPELYALQVAVDRLEGTLAGIEAAPAAAAAGRLVAELRGTGADLGPARADGQALAAAARVDGPALSTRLAALSRSVRTLSTRFADPRLVRFAAALDEVAPLLARFERARATAVALRDLVDHGQGSLGALLQDVELADELKAMLKQTKREPWRALGHP